MFIELTEILACPACDAGAGMVAFVDRLDGRHVVEGYLGCPFCEERRPVQGGVVHISAASNAPVSAVGAPPDQELAIHAAALLGLHERPGGYVLLDEGLAGAAPQVADLAAGTEIVALAGLPENASEGATADRETDLDPTVSYIVGASPDSLPILPGKLRGIVLRDATTARVESAVRALGFDGRLVVLRPDPAVRTAVEAASLRLLAADERALVAVRE
jgi:hypothetical protein